MIGRWIFKLTQLYGDNQVLSTQENEDDYSDHSSITQIRFLSPDAHK